MLQTRPLSTSDILCSLAGNCSFEAPNRGWLLDQLFVDGSLKEICSRLGGGIAESSLRLNWSGLGEWFRLTWSHVRQASGHDVGDPTESPSSSAAPEGSKDHTSDSSNPTEMVDDQYR